MKKFNILKGIPAHLSMINVDTDMIIPKQFLKTIKRTGLGKSLFHEIRYDQTGKKIKEFEEKFSKKIGTKFGVAFNSASSALHAAVVSVGVNPGEEVIVPPTTFTSTATSSLDSESEELVKNALVNLMRSRTSLVIAHRLSTIENADKIIVLNNGEITEQGSHSELIKKDGHYKKLYDLQYTNS